MRIFHLMGLLLSFALSAVAQQPFPTQYRYLEADGPSDAWLVAIDMPIHEVKQRGYVVLKRLGTHTYIVQPPATIGSRQSPFPNGITHYGAVNSLWKVSDELRDMPDNAQGTFICSSKNPEMLADALRQRGFSPSVEHGLAKVLCTVRQAKALAELPLVSAITMEAQSPKPDARVLSHDLALNAINALQQEFPDLRGQGMVVSIQEPFFDTTDIDLLGKYVASGLEANSVNAHTTDMATIIAGNGVSSYSGGGVAPQAKLASSDFEDALPDAAAEYQRLGIAVQNHSYGTTFEHFYGALARAFDQSAIDNPSLLHVFSAGNAGLFVNSTGPYRDVSGYATITGNFKLSKNTISVGALDTANRVPLFSSNGPTFDGRVKPELVANGAAGTSNAAALVSGTAALLQQAYKAEFGQYAPAALIKAILINSATDVMAAGLDFRSGYGSLNALRAMRELKAGRTFSGQVQAGGEQTFSMQVPSNAKSLKITLVWADPAAEANSAVALVNDLDLSVNNPNGFEFLPWVLNSSPDASLLALPAERKKDGLNNVEQVSIASPMAGAYQIRVKGHSMETASQAFYIAYQYDEGGAFEFTYPKAYDFMPLDGEAFAAIRWSHSLDATLGDLHYRLAGQETWTLIASNVNLAKQYHRWIPPNVVAEAQVRMTAGGKTYISEKFSISQPLDIGITLACGDSVLLRWPKHPTASAYRIYGLIGNGLQAIGTTTETAFFVHPEQLGARYFAAVPFDENGHSWARSYILDHTGQGLCYMQSFFAVNEGEASARLFLDLSDRYGVASVQFERKVADAEFASIGSINDPQSLSLEWLDEAPADGYNEYRAVAILENGQRVPSNSSEIYVLKAQPYQVFPNPVSVGGQVQVFSRGDWPDSMRVYDGIGRLLWDEALFSEREYLDIPFAMPGLYYYQLMKGGKPVQEGKIVVNWP